MTNTNLQTRDSARQRVSGGHHFGPANHRVSSVLDVAEGDEVLDDLVFSEEDESIDMSDLLLDDAD